MVITKKDVVRVVAITKDHRIEGNMHVLEGARLTDSLNSHSKDFYALTDARILRLDDNTVIASPPYIAVARQALSAIFPVDE